MKIYITFQVLTLLLNPGVNKIGEGVGLYIAEGYDYILRGDLLSADVDIIETVFIELVPLSIVVGCVYRPPSSDVAICTAYIDSLLSKLNKEKNLLYCR